MGRTQQFTATYFPVGRGNSQGRDVTMAAAWTSSDTSITTVGYGTGLTRGQSGSSATITARYAGLTGTAHRFR